MSMSYEANFKPSMVIHTYNPSTQEPKARELQVRAILHYTVRSCLRKQNYGARKM